MRSPVDTVKGRIVDYDPRTKEVTIKCTYQDWPTMAKRQYKECLVQMIDSRRLSDKQRRACYALLKEISEHTGMGLDPTKEYMKLKFLSEELQETADKIFSLSNAPMSLVCAFQRFLVRFILDWEIPCRFPLLDYVDDTSDYLYACLMSRKCCVCGREAWVYVLKKAHTSKISNVVNEGDTAISLCEGHRTLAESIGDRSFLEKYHIRDGVAVDKAICKNYKRG